jgi:hypothetical protein
MNVELANDWWESISYNDQVRYLENHKRSKRKITKKPTDKKADTEIKNLKSKTPKQLEIKFKFRKGTDKLGQVKTISSLKNVVKTLTRFTKGKNFSVLAAGMVKDFKRYGSTAILNQKVENTKDLASVMQIYRDPNMETFRIVYTKENKVVGHNTISCRLPHAVAFNHIDVSRSILYDIEDLKADSYYMVHNHPSGRSKPSYADIKSTQDITTRVFDRELDRNLMLGNGMGHAKFGGHVVINHKEYSTIDEFGLTETIPTDSFKDVYETHKETLPHKILSEFISNRHALAYVAAQLTVNAQSPNDNLLVTRGVKEEVKFVTSIDNSVLTENYEYKKVAPYLRKILKDVGAIDHFLVVKKTFTPKNIAPYLTLLRDNLMRDIADENGTSLIIYAQEQGIPPKAYEVPKDKRGLLDSKSRKFKGVNE